MDDVVLDETDYKLAGIPRVVCAYPAAYSWAMELVAQIPDDVARRPGASVEELSRRSLEAFALDEYKNGRLSTAELRRVLQHETRAALDGFLKAHGVFTDYTLDDLELDRQDLTRAGF